ncbi:hypothetical protein GHT07_20495 [Caenimonas koreensis DSM 17982]|uniref:JmjC domain-containing protein n=1 Tax=Caenimonas koreensis DSM 17982 TaxID=1121255 RepID=A0A844BD83_9BURK|nr:cupin domain-containing protein [Caenimonas koreensis]MRD49659.1 hypothetical protein [Caenimonas koreensis DSM 17982]
MLPHNFFQNHWLKAPLVCRGLVSTLADGSIDWSGQFKSWAESATVQARLFSSAILGSNGEPQAHVAKSGSDALAIFEQHASAETPLTLLLNGCDSASPLLRTMRERLNLKRTWREDDIVATMSSHQSGIGFHSGHEDGFLVQLEGTRVWRFWEPASVPRPYLLSLLAHPDFADEQVPPPPGDPEMEFVINAGDAIYLPSLWGHSGITVGNSVALSIAWKGITPFSLLVEKFGKRTVLSSWPQLRIYSDDLFAPVDHEDAPNVRSMLLTRFLEMHPQVNDVVAREFKEPVPAL